MPIDLNSMVIATGASGNLSITDTSGNRLYSQDNQGRFSRPFVGANTFAVSMFMVGYSDGSANWTTPVSSGNWGKLPFGFTGGNGYLNVNGCYDLVNYRFTAPWTGMYLFKVHNYIYTGDGGNYNQYCHPVFYVNGSSGARRPNGNTPYRIRQYGFYGSYGHDTDCCELIYLTAADYVEAWWYSGNNGMQTYNQYCSWSGIFTGS